MSVPLVEVRALAKHFPVRGGWPRASRRLRAVDGVTFDIHEGETLGLVGESGCGKSTTGRALLRLVEPTSGEVRFGGRDLSSLGPSELRHQRRHMQMIFQDPFASLNPRLTVGRTVAEPLEVHGLLAPAERRERVAELLGLVGLDPAAAGAYPHEFSGGQRQRIGIARALATRPRFVVADEPLSALDVSVQAQVVNLLSDLKARLGLTYLFVAHDLALVRHLSDRVAVMYLGRIVELAEGDAIFARPRHPYTRGLLASAPRLDEALEGHPVQAPLGGEAASLLAPPTGCGFHPRCPFATDRCRGEDPALRDLGEDGRSHTVACHHAETLPPYGKIAGAGAE